MPAGSPSAHGPRGSAAAPVVGSLTAAACQQLPELLAPFHFLPFLSLPFPEGDLLTGLGGIWRYENLISA